MRKPNRTPTAIELIAFLVALLVGFGVATYFGNAVAGIAVVLAIAIIGSGFFYAKA
ncbi:MULTISPECIES: hypothetical protein [Mycolicibacterium]|uniref:Uncharacterized protein n=1 Tax=Mycolicibacterium mageritense TaxID=53462 RepID=A0AAI8TW06_MYCME|nr:hypothetical protein [Mycolicibacterium mageritense]MBN3452504.1 hypothetical protein [Mycobacterium sp. DSM 3803]MCC9183157.1 hypothetical protein [Mycolicibacterium mageritense]CDO20508.1 hypothetical protein BN978_00962 [Mycolicibacterium mageritense DSM 44476 = CIP 104973]BBX34976.1 hypothetical protein MMAGJ_42580 [Mycolicibacterium mageritense]BDY29884.1 hypothetical protein hbim_03827 [Mycolicibacterium mageritense]